MLILADNEAEITTKVATERYKNRSGLYFNSISVYYGLTLQIYIEFADLHLLAYKKCVYSGYWFVINKNNGHCQVAVPVILMGYNDINSMCRFLPPVPSEDWR